MSKELDYRRYANRIRDAYTLNEAEMLLTELVGLQKQQWQLEARIDELENLRCHDMPLYHSTIIKDRISELKAQLKQSQNKDTHNEA